MRSYTGKSVQKEWASWIANVFGPSELVTELVTFTFRTPQSGSTWTEPGTSYVKHAMLKLDRKLTVLGMTWFGVVERGSDTRRLHLHYLVRHGDPRWLRVVRLWWERDYGFTQASDVRTGEAVSVYVTKYVTKAEGHFTAGGAGWRT